MRNTDLLPTTGPESLHLANIYSAQCEVLNKPISALPFGIYVYKMSTCTLCKSIVITR